MTNTTKSQVNPNNQIQKRNDKGVGVWDFLFFNLQEREVLKSLYF